MCLVVKKGTRRRTAKKDIKTLKVVEVVNGKTCSPFYGTLFENKNKSEMILDPLSRSVGKGLHSFLDTKKGRFNVYYRHFWTDWRIIKTYIPKGAEYYLGEKDDIVSTELNKRICV